MAIEQVNSYSPSDTSPENLMITTDDTRTGLHQVTITEYSTSTVPAVAVGSVIEVNGTLYKAGLEQTISGSPSDGTVYIYMVPSGTSPDQILTPTFTNTAPTWFDSKQGWYDSTGAYRYIHYGITKAASSYIKWDFSLSHNRIDNVIAAAATQIFDTTTSSQYITRSYTVSSVDEVAFSSLTNFIALSAWEIQPDGGAQAVFPTMHGDSIWFQTTSGSFVVSSGKLFYYASA